MARSVEEIAIIREACKQDLLFFTRYMYKQMTGNKFIVNWHHKEICEHLTKTVNREIKNLIINVPPRYSKTELAVINFIPWCFLRNPSAKFIHLSYSNSLVLDNSSRVRELINHESYQELLPIRLNEDSNSKQLWKTSEGGGIYAAPTGGAITGFGAGATNSEVFSGAIIIDDPLKVDDARSDQIRGNINQRLPNTIMSRRNSRDTPIILIMQRIHEEDMTGYILAGKTGEQWSHLKIPALDAGGVPLWELKHTKEELEGMRDSPDPAVRQVFAGQYQQEPAPEDGDYFKKEWIKQVPELPDLKTMNIYGGSDYAVSEGKGDYTVHVVIGIDPRGKMYLLDLWRKQSAPDEWINAYCDLVKKYKPIGWAEETGQIRSGVGAFIDKRARELKAYTCREVFPTRGDKSIRAQSIRGRMAQIGLHVQINAPWLHDLEQELIKFPYAVHDDQVDALGLVGQLLDKMAAGRENKAINTTRRLKDYRTEEEGGVVSWKTV